MTAIEFHSQVLILEPSLNRFAYRLTEKRSDARDLVQETILKVLINKDKFVNDLSLKGWIFTIMKNIFINNYRKNIRRNLYFDHTKELFFINHIKSNGDEDPASSYSAKEINQNIGQLKDDLRIPFEMYIQGFKYQEIADELKLNIGTIKSRIFLSRKKLMKQLA